MMKLAKCSGYYYYKNKYGYENGVPILDFIYGIQQFLILLEFFSSVFLLLFLWNMFWMDAFHLFRLFNYLKKEFILKKKYK